MTTPIDINGSRYSIGAFETVTRTIGFECSSGRLIEHEWTGIPMDRLVAEAAAPEDATHVLVHAADDYTACIDLPAALAGMLALERDGDPLEAPRFVSPKIVGPRAVSAVIGLDFIRLAPTEDPTEHEAMDLVQD